MDKYSKIGVFDSGLGGISVLSSIRTCMPNESFVYIGDSLHAPYGTKSREDVVELSKAICNRLIEDGVKAIVIACNTATSAAVEQLRRAYDIPIIGMEPAIKPALSRPEGRVFVFATEMTLKEEKFNALVEKLDTAHRIVKCPAPEWVEVVENAYSDTERVRASVASILSKYDIGKHDSIVLGCTHFVFLKKAISAYYNDSVEMYDGNMGTALQLKNTLSHLELLSDAHEGDVTVVNTKSEDLVELGQQLLEELEMRTN